MATMLNSFAALPLKCRSSVVNSQFPSLLPATFTHCCSTSLSKLSTQCKPQISLTATSTSKNNILCCVVERSNREDIIVNKDDYNYESDELDLERETVLYSFNPLPFMLLAALPGGTHYPLAIFLFHPSFYFLEFIVLHIIFFCFTHEYYYECNFASTSRFIIL